MNEETRVLGSYIQAYLICARQAWLMSRQIAPDEDHVYLALGRLIGAQAYGRERKEVRLDHLALDLVQRGGRHLVIGEVKKSSRALEAARLQLAFYLYELRTLGIAAEGELLFPEERRRERLVLDTALARAVKEVKGRVQDTIAAPSAPPPVRGRFCSRCAYAEFCWA